jgi:MYXO-CTERM domain-containing protein
MDIALKIEALRSVDEQPKNLDAGSAETAFVSPSGSKVELPDDAIELAVDRAFSGETPTGLPFNLVTAGDKKGIEGTNATVQEGVYVMAPKELAASLFDPPMQRKVSGKAAAVAAGVAGVLTFGACAGSDIDAGSGSDTAIDQMTKNLALPTDTAHLGPDTDAGFTQSGDIKPNGLEGNFNTETVVTIIREDGGGVERCYYARGIDAQDAIENLGTSAELISLPGIQAGDPPIGTCAVYNNEIFYKRGAEPLQRADLVDNAGTFTAANNTYIMPGIGSFDISIVEFGGVGNILYSDGSNVNVHNLSTGIQTATNMPTDCGMPHADENTGKFVGSKFDTYSGPITCQVVEADNQTDVIAGLNALAQSINFIPGVMDGTNGSEGDAEEPRLIGQYLVFQAEENNGGTLDPPKIKYKAVLMYCGDAVCNNGENSTTCSADCGAGPVCGDGTQDTGEVCDDNNNIDGDGCSADCLSDETCGNGITDTITGETCDDGTSNSDTIADACRTSCAEAACGDDVVDTGEVCDDGNTTSGDGCSNDCTSDETPVCGDAVCEPPETNATCAADCDPAPVCGDGVCQTPETNASCAGDCFTEVCQTFVDDMRIEFTEGRENCDMTDCMDTALEEGFKVEGNCSFEIDFGNSLPVEFSIYDANGSDGGGVAIDFIEDAAHELLYGGAEVNDNGNHHGSTYRINGNTIETVAEGTGYISEVASMPNGDDAYYAECLEDTIKVYKNGELLATFTDDGSIIVDMSEQTTTPDGGVPDGGLPDGGTPDGGTGGGDDPSCGGCEVSGKTPKGDLIAMGLMLLGIAAAIRRRRRESTEENAERSPGSLILGDVKKSVAKFFDKFKKAA